MIKKKKNLLILYKVQHPPPCEVPVGRGLVKTNGFEAMTRVVKTDVTVEDLTMDDITITSVKSNELGDTEWQPMITRLPYFCNPNGFIIRAWKARERRGRLR